MNTCGTCKHFGELVYLSYFDEAKDETVENKRLHVCRLLRQLNSIEENIKASILDPAGVIDASGYYAAFCVSEEFGCNQWKAADGERK